MDSSLKRLLIFSALITWAIAPNSLQAGPIFTYAGKTVRWNLNLSSPPLKVFIDSSAASITTTIGEALTEWSTVSGSLLQLTTTGTQADAQIVIGVGAQTNGFSSGFASPSYNSDGELVGCTVTLGSGSLTATSDQARSLVLHEVGHCLGLVHSTVRSAVMSYRAAASHLTDDDRLSLVRLYPADGSQDLPMGCATTRRPTNEPGEHGGSGLLSLGVALAFAWWMTHGRFRSAANTSVSV